MSLGNPGCFHAPGVASRPAAAHRSFCLERCSARLPHAHPRQPARPMQARIRDAARALFVAHGYEPTTIADIRTSAGISNGSFFHAFDSKSDVAMAVWEEACGAHEAAVLPRFETHTEPAATVREVIQAELTWFEAHPDLATMLVELPACLPRQGSRSLVADTQTRLYAAIRRWLAHTPPGTVAPLPVPVIAAVLFGPPRALCSAWLGNQAGERPTAFTNTLAAAAWAALPLGKPARVAANASKPGRTAEGVKDLFSSDQSRE